MIFDTTKGSNDGQGKPIRTFHERHEINLRKFIEPYLHKERVGDTDIYVVKDLDELIFGIMTYYEQRKV